jgi:hypothetical protein
MKTSDVAKIFHQFANHPNKIHRSHMDFLKLREQLDSLDNTYRQKIENLGAPFFIFGSIGITFIISVIFTGIISAALISFVTGSLALIGCFIIREMEAEQKAYHWFFPRFRKNQKIRALLNQSYFQILDNREYQYELLAQIEEYAKPLENHSEWLVRKYSKKIMETQSIMKSRFIDVSVHPEKRTQCYESIRSHFKDILQFIQKIDSVVHEKTIRQDFEDNQQAFMQKTRNHTTSLDQAVSMSAQSQTSSGHGIQKEKEQEIQLDIQKLL